MPEAGGIYATDGGCLGRAGPLAGVLLDRDVIDRAPSDGILVAAQNPVGVAIEGTTVRGSGGSGIHLGAGASAVRVEANNVARSLTFDCEDDSSGGGTSATGNIWTRNHGRTSSPVGLCVQRLDRVKGGAQQRDRPGLVQGLVEVPALR